MRQFTAAQAGRRVFAIPTGWTFVQQHLLTPLLDLVFPPACAGCGRVGILLCDPCLATIRPVEFHHQPDLAPLEALGAVGRYEGLLQRAVQALKYEGATALATPLGQQMARRIADAAWEPGVFVPVPLHQHRLATRGYNQAALLARAAASALGWPYRDDLLSRVRATHSQVGLDHQARQENVRDAFALASPESLQDRSIILVDDVYTTGATIRECASVLAAAGAGAVRAFVVGKTGLG